MSDLQAVTIRVPKNILKSTEKIADIAERSRSWVFNDALKDYIETQEWQLQEVNQALIEEKAGDFASPENVKSTFDKLKNESYLAQFSSQKS